MTVDFNSWPPWSNNALRHLGDAFRDGVDPPTNGPSYADVLLWYSDLAAEVQTKLENESWSIADKLAANPAARLAPGLLVSSRPKTRDTLVEKLQRRPTLPLDAVSDLAGVRIDADLLLGEQTDLAREIANHFGADDSDIVDRRDGAKAGYRAVHVDIRLRAGRVEIQVRTILQSLWANLYEKLADEVGRSIRYGEPVEPPPDMDPERIERAVQGMQDLSAKIAGMENTWQQWAEGDDPALRAAATGGAVMDRAMAVATFAYAAKKASSAAGSEGEGG
jgi:ppGpp synthetase/RelA/SpoT-type nucleotidyltranferase